MARPNASSPPSTVGGKRKSGAGAEGEEANDAMDKHKADIKAYKVGGSPGHVHQVEVSGISPFSCLAYSSKEFLQEERGKFRQFSRYLDVANVLVVTQPWEMKIKEKK
jgi:hypothetical protein